MKEGGIKQFLKPNLLKIILTILFLVLSYFFLPIPCRVGAVVPDTVFKWTFCTLEDHSSVSAFLSYRLNIGNGPLVGVFVSFLGIRFGETLAILIALILSYLLSCVISSFLRKMN